MGRALLVVAAGLIGILLGIGLSLAADAIAGNELSQPVPLGISADMTGPARADATTHERPTGSPTDTRTAPAGDGTGGRETSTAEPPSDTGSVADGSSRDGNGGSGGSSGEDPGGSDDD